MIDISESLDFIKDFFQLITETIVHSSNVLFDLKDDLINLSGSIKQEHVIALLVISIFAYALYCIMSTLKQSLPKPREK